MAQICRDVYAVAGLHRAGGRTGGNIARGITQRGVDRLTRWIAGVEKNLELLEQPGGIAMSDYDSGTQWDLPFGWAPASWIAIDGIVLVGDSADAVRISKKFSKTIQEGFAHDATIREKYNVVSGNAKVDVATGYKMNVVGFGWTNAVYLKMQDLIASGGKSSAK